MFGNITHHKITRNVNNFKNVTCSEGKTLQENNYFEGLSPPLRLHAVTWTQWCRSRSQGLCWCFWLIIVGMQFKNNAKRTSVLLKSFLFPEFVLTFDLHLTFHCLPYLAMVIRRGNWNRSNHPSSPTYEKIFKWETFS